MMNRLLFALLLVFSVINAGFASSISIYEGTYKQSPASLRPLERVTPPRRCFVIIDSRPEREASSEAILGVVVYGRSEGAKIQYPSVFGARTESGATQIIAHRLIYAGSTASAVFAQGETEVANTFRVSSTILRGFLTFDRGGGIDPRETPKVLTGNLVRVSAPDLSLPPTFVSGASYQEVAVAVRLNADLTTASQGAGDDWEASVERVRAWLDAKGYSRLP